MIVEAQEGLLCAILHDNGAFAAVPVGLTAEDFTESDLGLIYAAARALHDDGRIVDPITLAHELERRGQLEKIGGQDRIGELLEAVPTFTHAGEHARIILESAQTRMAATAFTKLAAMATEGRLSPIELAERAQRVANALASASLAQSRFLLQTDRAIEALPSLSYLVDAMIPAGSFAALISPPGSGKSFCALDLCVSVATGHEWLGRQVLTPGPAILIAAEGRAGLRQRLEAVKHARGLAGQSIDVFFILEAVNFFDGTDPAAFGAAVRQLAVAPVLIIVDTLHRSMEGADENSARDMGRVIAAIDRVRKETGAACLAVHHTNKAGDTERGSTSLRGAVDTLLQLRKDEDGQLMLSCEKMKDGPPFPPIGLELIPTLDSCVIRAVRIGRESTPQILTPSRLAILKSIAALSSGDGVTRTVLVQDNERIPLKTVYRNVTWLREQGYVTERKKGNGVWFALTDSGRSALDSHDSHSFSNDSHGADSAHSHASHTPLGVRAVRNEAPQLDLVGKP